MTQEEKAKAYDEAIERAENFIENGDEIERTIAESIFAGIMEVSKDEKIRKAIGYAIGQSTHSDGTLINGVSSEEAIAWLEKQAEHANFRNKIQVGDEVTRNEDGVLVNLSQLNRVAKKDEKQGEQNKNHKTMIVKFICKKDWHGIGDYYYGKIYNGYPCDKEQKGYDIYDDNHVPTFCDEDFIDEYFNIVTEEKQAQKPAWSEEDEKILNYLLWFYDTRFRWNDTCSDDIKFGDIVTFLKSLKDRVQPKQEWSEEDEKYTNIAVSALDSPSMDGWYCFNNVKSADVINWFKSLKDRYTWKPSGEQMKGIECAIKTLKYKLNAGDKRLNSLYNDLKKLREE